MLKKRILGSITAFCIICYSFIPVYAASRTASEAAGALYTAGLFQGTGAGADGTPIFALGDRSTRAEAMAMLVRLLGREKEAVSGAWSTPFADVPDWATPYVGYAYENGLTKGVSSAQFGADEQVTANDFLTLVLRALSYDDSAGDFTHQTSALFAGTLGLGSYNGAAILTRGDMAKIACNALYLTPKGEPDTLLQQLVDRGAVNEEDVSAAGLSAALNPDNAPADITQSSQKPAPGKTLSASEIYEKCSPAVFSIILYDEAHQQVAYGSGFFISGNGMAVTNYHVIENSSSAEVILADGKSTYAVKGVYAYSIEQDLAILQIDGTGFDYLAPAVTPVVNGATVYALGSPQMLDSTISQGLVSNANRMLDGRNLIQISAPISPGSSGGAILNDHGEVIGVTMGTITTGQSLNFAIPYETVQALPRKSLRTLQEILREGTTGTLSLSAQSVTLRRGESATLTLTQTYPQTAGCSYALSRGIAAVDWGDWSSDGKTLHLKLTGLTPGDATLTLKLYNQSEMTLAQTTINIKVTN